MDCGKMGRLIRQLRTEQGMTQAALGARLGVCAKTISKWECGRGCPDLSLVGALARITGVDAAALLDGELRPEAKETGSVKTSSTTTNKAPPKERYSKQARKGRLKL